jgi:hypothetical protein
MASVFRFDAKPQGVGFPGILHQAGLVGESARQQQGIHRLRQASEAVVGQGACCSERFVVMIAIFFERKLCDIRIFFAHLLKRYMMYVIEDL